MTGRKEEEAPALEALHEEGPAAVHEEGEPAAGTPQPGVPVPVGGTPAQRAPASKARSGRQRQSKFANVSRHTHGHRKWYGQVGGSSTRPAVWTPSYRTEEEAARAVDR